MPDSEDQEDELTALSSIYEEKVFVTADDKKGGQFVVNVSLPEKFNLLLDGPVTISVALKAGAKPVQKDDSSLLPLRYLPPIMLHFQYPDDYPSCKAPQYTLSCKWLSPMQIGRLCIQLDTIWEENQGQVILFQWIQFLQEESFTFLDLQEPLQLDYSYVRKFTRTNSQNTPKHAATSDTQPPDQCGASGSHGDIAGASANEDNSRDRVELEMVDRRAIQDVASLTNLISSLVSHDTEEKQQAFDSGFYHCQICFEEKMGSECLSFLHCGHVYCKLCITEYFNIQITEGNVKALHCPEQKCDSQASQTQVRSLVSEELFARYDRLLLQHSLDGMDDVTNCPRISCQCPVMKEEDISTMAVCPSCRYAFCTLCNMAYHGVSPCRVRKKDMLKLKEEYDNGDEVTKEFLEKKYGRKVLKRILEDSYSEIWIDKNSRKCPVCGSSIQKIDGCNKMTCTKCHSYFCWLCMKILSKANPYQHFQDFNSPCNNLLFEGLAAERDDDDEDDMFGDNWMNVDGNIDLLIQFV